MANTVHCDRCQQDVEGFIDPDPSGMSGGVYVGWTEFMNPGERVICDRCMWSDPRYIKIYGHHQ